jgi:hypothetical protein
MGATMSAAGSGCIEPVGEGELDVRCGATLGWGMRLLYL